MSSQSCEVQFGYSARYITSGLALGQADQVWICLHGYGQLAPYFIRKFQSLADRIHLVVPEGLHRFYLEASAGRVGASWMTKEDRNRDIDNYLSYIDAVIEQVKVPEHTPIVLVGFSQGAATAARYLSHSKYTIEHVILWSGMLPPDVDLTVDADNWSQAHIHQVTGDADPYYNDARWMESQLPFVAQNLTVHDLRFTGGHEIRATELELMYHRIASMTAKRSGNV